MNILFRCDGSAKIGMGHVVRCMALADHLTENHNCKIHFAMRESELGINKVKETYLVLESNEKDFQYSDWLFNCINETNSQLLIMDIRDGLKIEELKQIKKRTKIKVVTIDDPEEKRLEADLAFYPPVLQLEKISWNGFKGKMYSGWEYVILRKEFLKQYLNPMNLIPNILISMGGSDPKDLTSFTVRVLKKLKIDFKAIIITGEGYHYNNKLTDLLAEVKYDYELFIDPENIAEVISKADFAIASFGMTAYELLALKIPSIYICLTIDHYKSSKIFVKKGLGYSIGTYAKKKEKILSESILMHLQKINKMKGEYLINESIDISNYKQITSLMLGRS